jgi:hypothetical protein
MSRSIDDGSVCLVRAHVPGTDEDAAIAVDVVAKRKLWISRE